MFNLAAFYKSQANGVTYDALTAVTDQALTVSSNGRYIFPANQKILAAHVTGINVSAARFNSPSLRSFVLPEIDPVNVAATIPTRPPIVVYGDGGPGILRNEEFTVETSRAGADAQPVTAGVWLTDSIKPAPKGPQFTLVASTTITLVQGAWTLGTLTFNQTLPAGEYTVVGMRCVIGDAIFARLVFPGMNQYRPGCTVDRTYTEFTQPDYFRRGAMGLWGKFISTAQPNVEVFGLIAGAETGAVYLDVIKTG